MPICSNNISTKMKKLEGMLPLLFVVVPFVLAFCILFSISPTSFSSTWTGRTFYLFFLWLIFLEIILDWEKITQIRLNLRSPRTLLLVAFSILPTAYVIAVNFLGVRSTLFGMVDWLGIPFAPIQRPDWTYVEWVISLEYLIFTAFFAAIVWLIYQREGIKIFSIPLVFLGGIGAIYMIDTLYPFGYFTPLQMFVPFTASFAAGVLNWLGYQTAFTGQHLSLPILAVSDSSGQVLIQYAIGWPCAGVQSLLIYTFVILIFFKKTTISLVHKLVYFVVGSFITYVVNIFRIVSIYLVYISNLSQGREIAVQAANSFHRYYGGLYGMTWIVAYPLIIVGSRLLWDKIKNEQSRFEFLRRWTQREKARKNL